jgi:hypothetical protein
MIRAVRGRLRPGRASDRLESRALAVIESTGGPSAFALHVLIERMDRVAESEQLTPAARRVAEHAVRFGYAIRVVEEVDGTVRDLDAGLLVRLEQARAAAPENRERQFDEVLADPDLSDYDRSYMEKLRDHKDVTYDIEVIAALVDDDEPTSWFGGGDRFFELSGYSPQVWRIIALKASVTLDRHILEEDPQGPRFPWEAIGEFIRLGYVLRCGDALTGWEPEYLRASPLL